MPRALLAAAALVPLLTMGAWPALAVNAEPVVPVLNGEFEISADAGGLVRPTVCSVAGDGYINIFQPGNPLDLPWLIALSPCQSSAVKALGWSSGMGTQFGDWDNDGDREARIAHVQDPNVGSNHNLWQAYNHPQQAFTGNFQQLRFRVEGGAIPSNAAVYISLSETPLSDVTPWVLLYLDCALVFPASMFAPDADGNIALNPAQAQLYAAWAGCADEVAAWNAAGTEAAKRAVLDDLRIVQHSYWNFNTPDATLLLDGVELAGARLAVQSLAGV